MLYRMILLVFLCCSTAAPCWAEEAAAAEPLPVAIIEDVMNDLSHYLKNTELNSEAPLRGERMRREVAEAILFRRALERGGFKRAIKLVALENKVGYIRYKLLIARGLFVAGVQPIWGQLQEKHPEQLGHSAALVREGEFVVGLYAAKGHPYTRARPTLDQVLDMQMTVGANWHVDRQLLETVGWRYTPAPTWSDVLRMLKMKRVEGVLAPFQPNKGMVFQTDMGELYPVPGYKVSFQGTRHYPVSTVHPQAESLLQALNLGIRAMHRDGSLKQMYTQSGFFNPNADAWRDVRVATQAGGE